MERVVTFHIEKLSEGVYLAASDDVHGLVAQGRTIQEAIDRARCRQEVDRDAGRGCRQPSLSASPVLV